MHASVEAEAHAGILRASATPSSLANWIRQAEANRTHGKTGLTTTEREELARLRKKLRIVQEERDILKKATAFFAKQKRRARAEGMDAMDNPKDRGFPQRPHPSVVVNTEERRPTQTA